MLPPRPVPRVARLSREEFERDYLAPSTPVVLDGAAASWPAFTAWQPARLREKLAGHRVKVASSEHDLFGYDEAEATYEEEEMDFPSAADLITRVRPSRRRYYLRQQSIPRDFPELAADLPALEYVGGARVHPHLWFGTENTLTPLHYDMANNLFAQLRGRKTVLLFHPDDAPRLYPQPADATHHNVSRLDPERDDAQAYPLLAEAQPWTCEVAAGDLLFVPAFWWHQVRSLDVGLSVSVWWAPRPAQFLTPMARRMTPVLYQRDRLLTLKAMVSDPGEYQGFLGMARFMDERTEPRLALLFAGAALEEALRMLYLKRIKPSDAATLRDARRMTQALIDAGALDADTAAALPHWLDAIAASVRGDDVGNATAVVTGVAGFVVRPAGQVKP